MSSRWQTQTLKGGWNVPPEERGDCVRACVASVLDVDLDSLPNPSGDDWLDVWHKALHPLGFTMQAVRLDLGYPGCLWIARVPSLNIPSCYHVVVACQDRLIHDPAINKKYDEGMWGEGIAACGGFVIVPHDPSVIDPPKEVVYQPNSASDTQDHDKKNPTIGEGE